MELWLRPRLSHFILFFLFLLSILFINLALFYSTFISFPPFLSLSLSPGSFYPLLFFPLSFSCIPPFVLVLSLGLLSPILVQITIVSNVTPLLTVVIVLGFGRMLRLCVLRTAPRAASAVRASQRLYSTSIEEDGEPTFNQCVELYFDEASSRTKWSPDILRELKEVNSLLSFKFSIEDEKDPSKVHTIKAYRAQHSHHRLPW